MNPNLPTLSLWVYQFIKNKGTQVHINFVKFWDTVQFPGGTILKATNPESSFSAAELGLIKPIKKPDLTMSIS